jgi:hypothetical protein
MRIVERKCVLCPVRIPSPAEPLGADVSDQPDKRLLHCIQSVPFPESAPWAAGRLPEPAFVIGPPDLIRIMNLGQHPPAILSNRHGSKYSNSADAVRRSSCRCFKSVLYVHMRKNQEQSRKTQTKKAKKRSFSSFLAYKHHRLKEMEVGSFVADQLKETEVAKTQGEVINLDELLGRLKTRRAALDKCVRVLQASFQDTTAKIERLTKSTNISKKMNIVFMMNLEGDRLPDTN